MKYTSMPIFLSIISLWVTTILGYPQGGVKMSPSQVSIVKDERSHPEANGTYSYDIVLTDGTKVKQSGNLEGGSSSQKGLNGQEEDSVLVIKGEYSFVDPQGKTHTVMYVADKNGFQPEGDEIPKVNTSKLRKNISPTKNETKIPVAQLPLKTISSSLFSSPSESF